MVYYRILMRMENLLTRRDNYMQSTCMLESLRASPWLTFSSPNSPAVSQEHIFE